MTRSCRSTLSTLVFLIIGCSNVLSQTSYASRVRHNAFGLQTSNRPLALNNHRPGTPPIFGLPNVYSTAGIDATSLAAADLNGDGNLDVVAANRCASANCPDPTGTVSVLLGNGDGTYKTAVMYTTGADYAVSVAIADVNGDGKSDLLVANQCTTSGCNDETGKVGVLLGNGDGTFKPAVIYDSGGEFALFVTVADVNGDNKPDLLVTSGAGPSGGVGVLLGNGDGTFKSSVTYPSGGDFPSSLAVGDLNGDGKLDLAVTNYYSDSVSILLGNGNGTFQAFVPYAVNAGNPSSVALADVNGDGKLDMITADCADGSDGCQSDGVEEGAVSVFIGKGDGTFAKAVPYEVNGEETTSVFVADVNKDGKLDLVLANNCAALSQCTESGGVAILLGNGDGTFAAPTTFGIGGALNPGSVAGGPAFAVAGDANGDGNLDLLAVNGGNTSTIGIVLGNGDGAFKSWSMQDSGGYGGALPAVADLNGDGKLDIVTGDVCNPSTRYGDCSLGNDNPGPGAVGVILGDGKGGFEATKDYNSGGYFAGQPAVADVNGDGKPDIVVTNQCVDLNCRTDGTVGVLLGNGDGTFKPVVTYDSGAQAPNSVAVADLNKDGKPDLIVVNVYKNSGSPGVVAVLSGNGDGTFKPAVLYSSGGYDPVGLSVEDLNGDGIPDVVVVNLCITSSGCGGTTNGSLGVLLGNSNGTFQKPVIYDSGGVSSASVVLTDVNGDGRQDILVANGNSYTATNLGVLFGNGDGTFQTVIPVTAPALNQITAADFNGDGKFDIAGGAGELLLGNGDGTFQAPINLIDSGFGIAAGDFNGDGKPDITIGHYVSADVFINISAENGKVQTGMSLASSPNPSNAGQSVIFDARVEAANPGTPAGRVLFFDGRTQIGSGKLNGQGSASFSTSKLTVGTHNITAVYPGNSDYGSSKSAVLKQVVKN